MSEDAASSSSSAHSRDRRDSPARSSAKSMERETRRSVVRTTEKSVVFRVRTQEKVSSGRGGRSAKQTLRQTQSEDTSGIDDGDVHDMLEELYAEAERKNQWLKSEEATFRRGQERLKCLQREHAELLRNLEQCKRRRKERVRIQKMLRRPEEESENYGRERSIASDSSSDSDYGSLSHRSSSRHHRTRRDGAKKERKRLRRFQSDVSLRFQLLQSECRRSDLEVEKLMTDLRREYTDSCLFGNSLSF